MKDSAAVRKGSPAGTRQDTRTRILDIACELFARKGFTGTSIADIARELGTTTAALYYHFPSKADILGGLLAEPLAAYDRIIEGIESAHSTPATLLGAFIDLAADSSELAQIIDRDPAVLELIDQNLPRKTHEMTDAIIAALAGPAPGHTTVVLAHAALSVVKGATIAALELGGGTLQPGDRDEILAAALRTLREPTDP